MNWLQRAMGWPDPPAPEQFAENANCLTAEPAPPPELPPTPTAHEAALAKARRDVRRFTVAIEACTKGEARTGVLRDDLFRAERRLAMLEEI